MVQENDIVLIYFEDKPVLYAKIEEILPDIKKDWYHVNLLMLTIPLQVATWILKDIYINGEEFTMNGKRIRLEKVVSPEQFSVKKTGAEKPEKKKTVKDTGSKIISFSELRKK